MAISQVSFQTKFSEWKTITNAIIDAIGDNANLSTTEKSSLVGAINEVVSKIGSLTSLDSTAKNSIVAAINEVIGELGDVSTIDSSLGATKVVAALNALVTKIGKLSDLNTTAKTNLVAAINELKQEINSVSQSLSTKIGDTTALNTTAKDNLVAAINEAVSSIGKLNSLSTTAKDNLVAAINELATGAGETNDSIGDLTSLTTTQKSTLVGAINELATLQLSRSNIPLVNKITNHGRFATETTKSVSTFDSTAEQMTVFNSSTVAQGDRFIDDNSTHGGAGGTLGADITPLISSMQSAGRTDVRNGFEFFIADYTVGGGTSNGKSFEVQNYYPFLTGGEFLGAIGSVVTFQAWVRVKALGDDTTFDGILLGDANGDVKTFINGVKVDAQSKLDIVSGWVHVSQSFVLKTESLDHFPAIYGNVNDVVQIALPTLYNAEVNGIHLGIV